MRFARTAALLGLLVVHHLLGPVVLLVVLVVLCFRRVRAWLRPDRPVVLGWAGAVVLITVVSVLAPGGLLPIPPGGGVAVTATYLGRPVQVRPVEPAPGQDGVGPSGDSVQVDSGWFGPGGCRAPVVVDEDHLLLTCGGRLRLVDSHTLRELASMAVPGTQGCAATRPHADGEGNVVLAHGDQVVVLSGDLRVTARHTVAGEECLVDVAVAADRARWWVRADGVVGLVGRTATLDLGEPVTHGFVVAGAAVMVATRSALVRLDVDPDGAPVQRWRTAYADSAAPVALAGETVAVTDSVGERHAVAIVRVGDGRELCRLDLPERAGDLNAVGEGVLVGVDGGTRRIDPGADAGACSETWQAPDVDADLAVSPPSGLAHGWVRRLNRWGVTGWYLTALDVHTGRVTHAIRGGLGWRFGRGDVVLGPDGAAYVATMTGLLRIRDRGRAR